MHQKKEAKASKISSIINLNELTQSIKRAKMHRKHSDFEPDEVLELIKAIGSGHCDFEIDQYNEKAYQQLMAYFLGDPKFNGNLTKGLLLKGRPGGGKTMSMYIFKKVVRVLGLKTYFGGRETSMDFLIIRTRDIVSEFEQNGYHALYKYKNPQILCLDDVGEEPKNSKYYANELNVIEEIMSVRYEKFVQSNYLTFITTNYTYESNGRKFFNEFYGERMEDRMKHMFNEIVFPGESRRK